MSDKDNTQLLLEYLESGSSAAFNEIVRRHLNLVYSAALRKVGGDVHLARDVVQLTFTDLALKANALPAGVILGGWLHHHTCFRAASVVRAERRRRAREQTASEMKMFADATDQSWVRLSPLLDDAVECLPARDRDAIVLRYFEGRSLAETGRSFGLTDDAAQKLVSRAVEKLRVYFAQNGVAVGTITLTAAISTNAVHAAPIGLSTLAAQTSLAAVSAPHGFAASFHGLCTLLMKHKAMAAFAGLVVVGLFALMLHEPALGAQSVLPLQTVRPIRSAAEAKPAVAKANAQQTDQPPRATQEPDPLEAKLNSDSMTASEVISAMAHTYATCGSYLDSGVVKTVFFENGEARIQERPFHTVFVRPDRFRFEFWEQNSAKRKPYIVWANGSDVRTWWAVPSSHTGQLTTLSRGLAGGTGISGGSAHTVPALLLPDQVNGFKLTDSINTVRGENEKVGGVDCIRIAGVQNGQAQTLWLDKTTFLVRQIYLERYIPGARTETTTTYNPVINVSIPDELLQLDIPESK
jgi:RNA polymerase sigma factor (sigma-70 family)